MKNEDSIADAALVEAAASKRETELRKWGIGEPELRGFCNSTDIRIITPGSDACESMHLSSALERRSPRCEDDLNGARATLGAAVSLVLRFVGREADPGKSREHALLCVLAERRTGYSSSMTN